MSLTGLPPLYRPPQATLTLLLDHLSLVASFSDSNRMTCQNLAVCFGPVLLTPTQESWIPSPPGAPAPPAAPAQHASGRAGRSFAHSEDIASAVDFKRHIEVLHYLLQLWPSELCFPHVGVWMFVLEGWRMRWGVFVWMWLWAVVCAFK